MGWRDLLRGAGFGNTSGVANLDLPLGAAVGKAVQLERTPFVRAISSGSFIDMPVAAESQIKAITRVNLALPGSLYRYYLAFAEADKKEIFLQLYVDAQGQIADIVYCTQLTHFTAETEEDVTIFTGAAGYGLGDKNYGLWRDQLAELGYGESDLRAAFGSEEVIDYWRDVGDAEQEFIAPLTGSEVRLDAARSHHGNKAEIYYMPYRRELKTRQGETQEAGTEYLFITTEMNNSGPTATPVAMVDLNVGIAVTLAQVAIQ